MSVSAHHKREARIRRHRRVRKKVQGTAEVIDDRSGRTLAAASTNEPDLRGSATGNKDAATKVGQLVAERAKAAGVTKVVFDRGGNLYHGRVAAVAAAARANGLEL